MRRVSSLPSTNSHGSILSWSFSTFDATFVKYLYDPYSLHCLLNLESFIVSSKECISHYVWALIIYDGVGNEKRHSQVKRGMENKSERHISFFLSFFSLFFEFARWAPEIYSLGNNERRAALLHIHTACTHTHVYAPAYRVCTLLQVRFPECYGPQRTGPVDCPCCFCCFCYLLSA